LPKTWDDLLGLAKAGKVAVPAIPIDLLMNFYSFCIAEGKETFLQNKLIDEELGIKAMQTMKELYSLVDKRMFECNPIAVAELMSSTNDYWYCPFAYGYSNYSRTGFADHLLHYADVITINNKKLRTTIGGTGISVSAFRRTKKQQLILLHLFVRKTFRKQYMCSIVDNPGI
jgi:multiple sugar transport system substrate-binding protein